MQVPPLSPKILSETRRHVARETEIDPLMSVKVTTGTSRLWKVKGAML